MRREKLNEYASDILFALALTFLVFVGIKGDIPFIATAFGASVYLSFINPYSKYSSAWNISASYVVAALYGIILNNLLKHELVTNHTTLVRPRTKVRGLLDSVVSFRSRIHPRT